jgi:hypothetical protein
MTPNLHGTGRQIMFSQNLKFAKKSFDDFVAIFQTSEKPLFPPVWVSHFPVIQGGCALFQNNKGGLESKKTKLAFEISYILVKRPKLWRFIFLILKKNWV